MPWFLSIEAFREFVEFLLIDKLRLRRGSKPTFLTFGVVDREGNC